MHVITFASTKGGVGKSTMAATATDGFIRRGDTVRVIDFDPQASLRKWAEPIAARTENLIVSKIEMGDGAPFADHYNALVDLFEDETDWVVIDTAGSDDFRQLAALAISDLVICPSGHHIINGFLSLGRCLENHAFVRFQGVKPSLDVGCALTKVGGQAKTDAQYAISDLCDQFLERIGLAVAIFLDPVQPLFRAGPMGQLVGKGDRVADILMAQLNLGSLQWCLPGAYAFDHWLMEQR